jgi:hypothetical protein
MKAYILKLEKDHPNYAQNIRVAHWFWEKQYKRELWIRGQIKLSIFKYLKAKEKFCEECSTATGRAKFFF